MKITKNLYKIILIMMIMVCTCCNCCYAADPNKDPNGGGSTDTGTGGNAIKNQKPQRPNYSITESDDPFYEDADDYLPDLNGTDFKPAVGIDLNSTTGAKNVLVKILSVLRSFGVVVAVIGIAMIGFGTVLGSANEKAVNQEKYIGIIIAALLIVGGSILAKYIINFVQKV